MGAVPSKLPADADARSLADPTFEPSDEQLVGIAERAWEAASKRAFNADLRLNNRLIAEAASAAQRIRALRGS